jgi:membrane protein DedA with SNARE-associated domain
MFRDHGFWAIVGIGVAPIPFQIAMLVAGASHYSIALFLLAAAIARGIRYYGLAALVRNFGDRAESLWQEHAGWVLAGVGALCALLVGASWLHA